MIPHFSSLMHLFRIIILHFSIPSFLHILELNILTFCISESRPLSVFRYNFRSPTYSRRLIRSLLLLNSWASLQFHRMSVKGIRPIMNSRESPWKIPCFIAYRFSSTFHRGMAQCKRFWTLLAIFNIVRHSMIQECGTISYALQ